MRPGTPGSQEGLCREAKRPSVPGPLVWLVFGKEELSRGDFWGDTAAPRMGEERDLGEPGTAVGEDQGSQGQPAGSSSADSLGLRFSSGTSTRTPGWLLLPSDHGQTRCLCASLEPAWV